VPSLASAADADAFVHAVVRDWSSAPLAAPERALCAYAVLLTRDSHAATRADLEKLRAAGFDDRAIHDAVQVIAYFNYVTRVADGLGIDPEPGLPVWGVSPADATRLEPDDGPHAGSAG
jgi:uncharacterized peroxidase-related enzyme